MTSTICWTPLAYGESPYTLDSIEIVQRASWMSIRWKACRAKCSCGIFNSFTCVEELRTDMMDESETPSELAICSAVPGADALVAWCDSVTWILQPLNKAPERSSININLSMRMFVFGQSTTGNFDCVPSNEEPVASSTNTDDVRVQKSAMLPTSLPEPAWTTMLFSFDSALTGQREMICPSCYERFSNNSFASFPVPAIYIFIDRYLAWNLKA